jgi:hypothetical protein
MLESKGPPAKKYIPSGALDLTFAIGICGEGGGECQIRSTDFNLAAQAPADKFH